MRQPTYAVVAAAMAIGVVAAACSSSPNSSTTSSSSKTSAKTVTTTVSQATTTSSASTDLRSMIPTPSHTQRTDGPEPIADNGIHLHFLVSGLPSDAMADYKSALEIASWAVTVVSSGGGQGGGGATYTATNGSTYGVFSGGGYGDTTDINACAWPAKPANPDCGHRE